MATALELIRAECPNLLNSGCRGADIRFNAKTGEVCCPAEELPKCLVALGLPCKFFERLVLPDVRTKSQYAGADRDYARKLWTDTEKALREIGEPKASLYRSHQFYGHAKNWVGAKTAQHRRCECGEPLGKGKRFCPACLKQHRRASYRRTNASRVQVQQSEQKKAQLA